MGLFKLCEHKDRARDRCDHPWWGSFRGQRASLAKWTNREIRTKEQAGAALDELRRAIRDGTFNRRGLGQTEPVEVLTFQKFSELYVDRHVKAKGLKTADAIDWRLKPLRAHFGDRLLPEIKTADIEDYIADLKQPRTINRQTDRRLTPASINRSIQLLRHMMNWAVGRQYLDRTPFRRGTELLIRLEHEDNKRRRRVSEEEEAALLAAASPLLRSMIIVALDTGMRRGEMLALRFGDIDWKRRLILLRGETTKSRRTRLVPIGTARLFAVLEWLRLDGTGAQKGGEVAVFSNEFGEPLKTFKKAWQVAVLKAHGLSPQWRKGRYKDITSDCQTRFREINLHWHDLRHEHASRLVERGIPLAQVRDLLGHASILTTERYDNQRLEALQAAVARLETGKAFEIHDDVSTDEVSTIFQVADGRG